MVSVMINMIMVIRSTIMIMIITTALMIKLMTVVMTVMMEMRIKFGRQINMIGK